MANPSSFFFRDVVVQGIDECADGAAVHQDLDAVALRGEGLESGYVVWFLTIFLLGLLQQKQILKKNC